MLLLRLMLLLLAVMCWVRLLLQCCWLLLGLVLLACSRRLLLLLMMLLPLLVLLLLLGPGLLKALLPLALGWGLAWSGRAVWWSMRAVEGCVLHWVARPGRGEDGVLEPGHSPL